MLFEPFSFSGLNLKNRLVRSATYEKRADEDGFVTEDLIHFYKELAKGGAGLIITGNALVHTSGRTIPQMICIHSDIYIQGLSRLTSAVHKLGGLIAIQLTHGGRQCFPMLIGETPRAPSAVFDPSTKIMPRAMADSEIWELVTAFADAAKRGKTAGFDAVQIHGAHGYLVSEFLSPHTNRREDYWGGDEERRFHFVEEVYKAIRKAVGDNYPLLIKLNSDDMLKDGLKAEEAARIALRLEDIGIDAVEISGGMYEAGNMTAQPDIMSKDKEAYFRKAGKIFKETLKIPVILVGGMRSREIMEEVLSKDEADLIALARPFIRESDLPDKLLNGKETADCISCNGCMNFNALDKVRCTQLT